MGAEKLIISVWDYDPLDTDDFLGQVEVDLAEDMQPYSANDEFLKPVRQDHMHFKHARTHSTHARTHARTHALMDLATNATAIQVPHC